MEENLPIAMATLLDPRFKTIVFINSARVITTLKGLVAEVTNGANLNAESETQATAAPVHETQAKAGSQSIWNVFEEIQAQHTQSYTDVSSSPTVDSEIKLYLEQKFIGRDENPLKWWEGHKNIFSLLYPLARKYLCIMATSVPSERLFSVASDIMSEKRNRLSQENLRVLFFIS